MKPLVVGLCAFVTFSGAFASEPLKLIPPWTPVVVKTSAAGIEVGVWGRSHKLAKAALPTSIVTAGREVLAAPIRLVGQVSGKPIEWKRAGNFLFRADKAHAIISGWQAGDDLIVNTTTQIEFDGVMRVDLVVMPQRKMSPKVEQLWLEVPLKRAHASLYHFWPGRWGAAKNSGAVPEAGLQLPFKPFVWLGWEDGGLGWFAESDKGWQPQDPKQPIEVVVNGDQTLLRLHLLDSPPPRLPVTYTFGFQASPVKPWPKDFHEWRICHGASYAMGSQQLDQAAKLGVKTLVFHEHWTPYQNYPTTTHEAELKKLVADCHKRGIKLLLYHGYEFASLAPEWGEMADETLVKTAAGGYTGGYHRQPEQRDYIVCYNSRY
ncbi:MAG: alpha-amylase family protein, partial [Verrucomicrobiae bacterium]|nr:alpha-amylase family protein [Verrucomicrobiae bacterium]